MRLVDAARSSSHLLYISKEDYGTLQQQWVSLLAAQHPISNAERVPQIGHVTGNLKVNPGKNDLVWIRTRGFKIM